MRIKLDENLPGDLAQILRDLGDDVETVPEEHLAGADDARVWRAAQLNRACSLLKIWILQTRVHSCRARTRASFSFGFARHPDLP